MGTAVAKPIQKPTKAHAAPASKASPSPQFVGAGRKLLKGVELFSTGKHTDSVGDTSDWTDADLAEVVANFPLLASGDRPAHIPPAGIGHDSAKGIPDCFVGDGVGAIGCVVALELKPEKINGEKVTMLVGDVAVDPEVYEWVQRGNLTRVSAEILENPPPEIPASFGAKGKTLRRIGLLGMSPPALKFIKPLQASLAAHSAAPAGSRRFCFASKIIPKKLPSSYGGSAMDRAAILQWLQEHGVDTSTITDAVPDALLQMLVDAMQKAEAAGASANAGDPNADKTRAGLPAGAAGAAAMLPGGGVGLPTMPASVTVKFAEYDRTIAALQAQLQQTTQAQAADRQNQNSAARKAMASNIRVFAEQAVKDGKMRRADIDCDPKTGEPLPLTELASLMRAADSPQVHAFAEAGKTTQRTALEMEMARISARPARMFAEKVAVGAAGATLTQGNGDKWKAIREKAIADRAKKDDGPSLHQRLGMIEPAGRR